MFHNNLPDSTAKETILLECGKVFWIFRTVDYVLLDAGVGHPRYLLSENALVEPSNQALLTSNTQQTGALQNEAPCGLDFRRHCATLLATPIRNCVAFPNKYVESL